MVRLSFPALLIPLLVGCDGGRPEVADSASLPTPATESRHEEAADGGATGAAPIQADTTIGLGQRADSPSASGIQNDTGTRRAPVTPVRSTPAVEAAAPAGTDANDILESAERAYAQIRSMEADFVQEVYVPLLDVTRNSSGKIYHRRPDLFAMRFSDPEGDLIVADGTYVWMYYPSTDDRQVTRSRLTDGGQQIDLQREFLSNATERYDATRTGSESVGGRTAHALTLVPRGPSPYRRIRIWVDTQDFLVRRFEIVEENETARELELRNLRPNATIPDRIFEFTPPPGAHIFEP